MSKLGERLTAEGWLVGHPYLEPLANFRARVEAAAEAIVPATASVPRWEDYRDDYQAGVPLLRSSSVALDLGPVDAFVVTLAERLDSAPQGPAAVELASLAAEISASRPRVVAWLLGDDVLTTQSPGLLRFLGWTTLARYLRPVVHGFGAWRDEDRWLRRICPTCGSLPGMAHLLSAEHGRERFLSCACCRTRWRYRRTECPFCEHDSDRLPVVTVEGEAGLRIDYCESCQAYLKTYDGGGDEALLLSDWTSLHLDVLAQDRGLRRAAVSLYDLELRADA
jgi:FdhE protein